MWYDLPIQISVALGGIFACAWWYAHIAASNKVRRYEVRAKSRLINIGIGLFPDAFPIILAERMNLFEQYNVKISFIDWSKAPDYLSNYRCDIIFGPTGNFERFLRDQHIKYITGTGLVYYRGFSIIAHHSVPDTTRNFSAHLAEIGQNSAGNGWKRAASQAPLDAHEAAKKTLSQLQGKTVLCMSDDAVQGLKRCLAKFEIDANKVIIKRTREPNAAFDIFVSSHSDIEAGGQYFVGGLTQRLQVEHRNRETARRFHSESENLRILISEVDFPLNTVEKLSFIGHSEMTGSQIKLVERAWFRAVALLDTQKAKELAVETNLIGLSSYSAKNAEICNDAIDQIIRDLNAFIGSRMSPPIEFDALDVDAMFNKFEYFAKNEDAAMLIEKRYEQDKSIFHRPHDEIRNANATAESPLEIIRFPKAAND